MLKAVFSLSINVHADDQVYVESVEKFITTMINSKPDFNPVANVVLKGIDRIESFVFYANLPDNISVMFTLGNSPTALHKLTQHIEATPHGFDKTFKLAQMCGDMSPEESKTLLFIHQFLLENGYQDATVDVTEGETPVALYSHATSVLNYASMTSFPTDVLPVQQVHTIN